jgi:putative DNA primase/helicase
LGVERAVLEGMVADLIKAAEKKEEKQSAAERAAKLDEKAAERERKREHEREQRRIEIEQRRSEREAERKYKERIKSFEALRKVPVAEHDSRLAELARRLDEDVEELREDFIDFLGPEPDPRTAPWPEAVDTHAFLSDLMAQVGRYVVVHDDGVVAVALWIALAWVHADVAIHSPLLAITSPDPECGKTTLLHATGFLTPRPFHAVQMTGAALYRIIEELHPTVFVDEADQLLLRNKILAHIMNAGWTRGSKTPRTLPGGGVRQYDLFAPKAIAMLGLAMSPATAGRAIVIKMLPKLPEEVVEDFQYVDDEDFTTLRRKAVRWSNDNAAALKDAMKMTTMPPGFRGRTAANWRLMFAIADLAGRTLGKRARKAAIRLSHKHVERSGGVRLLEAMREMFADRKAIASADLVKRLTADADAEWVGYRGHGPITQRQVAALLAPFDIRPSVIHPSKRSNLSPRGYRAEQFADAFRRFLDPHIRTLAQKRPRK